MSDQRKPENLYRQGDEPDPRFSLANERTALAWMRTALALVAAGIAITSISSLGVVPRWTALIGAAASEVGKACSSAESESRVVSRSGGSCRYPPRLASGWSDWSPSA